MRQTWKDTIKANSAFFYDPSLVLDSQISVGHFLGTEKEDPVYILKDIIARLRDGLGLKDADISFFGSSAGGFVALKLGALFEGSKVIVNAPQIDLRKWHYIEAVKQMGKIYFANENWEVKWEELKTHKPRIFNIVEFYKSIGKIPSKILYIINRHDKHHVMHYNILMEFLLSQKAPDVEALNTYFELILENQIGKGHVVYDTAKTIELLNTF